MPRVTLIRAAHFDGDNPYLQAIENHMTFLKQIVATGDSAVPAPQKPQPDGTSRRLE